MLTTHAEGVGGDARRSAKEEADQLMAQRAKEKVKRPAAGRVKAQPATAANTADTRVKALQQECDRLKLELENARQRIAALEESRSLVASRIDWVIESLNGVVDSSD